MSYNNRYLNKISDRRTFKLIYLRNRLGCPICGPGKGCNKRYKAMQRNWKKFRKTKYKDEKEIRSALSNKTRCECQKIETEQN